MELGHKPNDFMEKKIINEIINDIDYAPNIYGLDMMYPPANIKKFST